MLRQWHLSSWRSIERDCIPLLRYQGISISILLRRLFRPTGLYGSITCLIAFKYKMTLRIERLWCFYWFCIAKTLIQGEESSWITLSLSLRFGSTYQHKHHNSKYNHGRTWLKERREYVRNPLSQNLWLGQNSWKLQLIALWKSITEGTPRDQQIQYCWGRKESSSPLLPCWFWFQNFHWLSSHDCHQ